MVGPVQCRDKNSILREPWSYSSRRPVGRSKKTWSKVKITTFAG